MIKLYSAADVYSWTVYSAAVIYKLYLFYSRLCFYKNVQHLRKQEIELFHVYSNFLVSM